MKKTFLIAGLIAGLTTTKSWSAQNVLVEYTCPPGCYVSYAIDGGGGTYGTGTTYAICRENVNGTDALCRAGSEPNVNIIYYATAPKTTRAIEKASETNSVISSARAATVAPKITKKVVYEEVISDEDIDIIEE